MIYPGNWKALCSCGRIEGEGMQLGCSFHRLFYSCVPICQRRASPRLPHRGPLKHSQPPKRTKPVWNEREKKTPTCLWISFTPFWDALRELALTLWMGFTALRSRAKKGGGVWNVFVFLQSCSRKNIRQGFSCEDFFRRMCQMVASRLLCGEVALLLLSDLALFFPPLASNSISALLQSFCYTKQLSGHLERQSKELILASYK